MACWFITKGKAAPWRRDSGHATSRARAESRAPQTCSPALQNQAAAHGSPHRRARAPPSTRPCRRTAGRVYLVVVLARRMGIGHRLGIGLRSRALGIGWALGTECDSKERRERDLHEGTVDHERAQRSEAHPKQQAAQNGGPEPRLSLAARGHSMKCGRVAARALLACRLSLVTLSPRFLALGIVLSHRAVRAAQPDIVGCIVVTFNMNIDLLTSTATRPVGWSGGANRRTRLRYGPRVDPVSVCR